MKKILCLIIVVFSFQLAIAQLWVVGDNFVFSKGTDIFVKDKINLDNDSKLYLREEAQLMQENNVANEGAGIISVFQEGTSNVFSYNYWSAPVGKTLTASSNEGFLNSQIKYPTVDTSTISSTDLTITAGNSEILPYNVRNGISDDGNIDGTALRIAGRWLYTYDSGGSAVTGYAGWSIFNGSQTTRPGYGFTMKGVVDNGTPNNVSFNGVKGQRYDFRGRPNNGTILVGVGNDNGTLAGNPYPSALDLKKFIQVNSDPSGTVKMDPWVSFWESQEETSHMLTSYLGGYARYVPMGFATNGSGDYDTDGEYLEAIFIRYDNDGNILTSSAQLSDGSSLTGPPGEQTSYGDADIINGKRRYAAIGQGFFISRTNTEVEFSDSSFQQDATPNISAGVSLPSTITGEQIEFNNSMRVFQKEDGTTSIFKSAPGNASSNPQDELITRQIPKMILNVVPNGLYARPLTFAFDDSTSQGYDFAWEGPISGRVNTDAYIKIGASGEYALSSQAFDEDMRLPIGVQVANSFTAPIDVEFELAFLVNFDPTNVYLHDTETDVYHDIKSGNKTLLIAPGHYTDRFEITFKNNSGILSNDNIEATNFDVFQNNRNKELTVLNPALEEVATISLYDLAGRQIFSSNPSSTEASYSFNTASLSSAIYIAKVTTTNNKETAVKVSVSN